MSKTIKLAVITSCIILISISFYLGYQLTSKKIDNSLKRASVLKRDTTAKSNYNPSEGIYADNAVLEQKITKNTTIEQKVKSRNTGKIITEFSNQLVPDELIGFTEDQAEKYFENFDMKMEEFSIEKIVVLRETSYLPDCYVVKAEDDGYLRVYRTDTDGVPTLFEDFEPVPCKNVDEILKTGIEVNTLGEIEGVIDDYE